MSRRKDELLDAIVDHLSQKGLSRLSLRPLAAAVGSSSRLLVFHFKTKENLIFEVVNEVQARLEKSFDAVAGAKETNRIDIPLKRYWRWATNEQNLRYLWLMSEAQTVSVLNAHKQVKHPARSWLNWTDVLSSNLPESLRDSSTQSLCRSVYGGLILELLSTGALDVTTRAIEEFIQLLLLKQKLLDDGIGNG